MVKLPSGRYFSERHVMFAKWVQNMSTYMVRFSGCDEDTYFCQRDGVFISRVLDSCTLDYVQRIGDGD